MAVDLAIADDHVPGRAAAWFVRMLQAERERWALWIPGALAVGVGLYFALPVEPRSWQGVALLAVASMAAWFGRRTPYALFPAMAMALVALGFAAAQLRTATVAVPVLGRDLAPVTVQGRIVEIEP